MDTKDNSNATNTFRIRRAVEADLPVIHELIIALAEYEKLSTEVVTNQEQLRKTLFASRPYAEALLGELHGEGIALALYFHNYSTFLGKPGIYLEDIFVRPNHRGHGYGLLLIHALCKIALERDCGRIDWSVLNWNEDAISFYKKIGAMPLDQWTGFRLDQGAIQQLAEID